MLGVGQKGIIVYVFCQLLLARNRQKEEGAFIEMPSKGR